MMEIIEYSFYELGFFRVNLFSNRLFSGFRPGNVTAGYEALFHPLINLLHPRRLCLGIH